MRQAIAYAIDRESLVRTKLPEGAQVATQFVPPRPSPATRPTWQPNPYDPAKAKRAARRGRRSRT